MSTYAVTFRIASETVGGRSYQDRYNGLVEQLKRPDHGFWLEPTSFALVESHETTFTFAERIIKPLSASHDMLFAFDPEDKSAAYFGKVQETEVLRSFFPFAKEVG